MKENNLLKRIRDLHNAFISSKGRGLSLQEGAENIAGLIGYGILIADGSGKILASHPGKEDFSAFFQPLVLEGSFAGNQDLIKKIRSGKPLYDEPCAAAESENICSIIPIGPERRIIGCLILDQGGSSLQQEKGVLAEISGGLIGLALLNLAAEKADLDKRNKELAEVAFESLSYSEVEAMREIMNNISNNESVVVASRIADSLGITRSVIVNALRKFESAGIIESRSLGMKGTFIRVKNEHALKLVASQSEKLGFLR